MNSSKQNVERLAILNAWVTSVLVALNLLTVYVVINVRTFESLAVVVFVSGTIGGAASNYRRLQEAYVQQLGKSKNESAISTIQIVDEPLSNATPPAEDAAALQAEITATEPEEPKRLAMNDEATVLLLRLQIFLSPLFGGLFAFVLYGIFASGIIQGEIFPRFKSAEEEYMTPYEFADKTVPATNEDAAKALLWAFIAGFTEGFVPNFIDRLVKDSEEDE